MKDVENPPQVRSMIESILDPLTREIPTKMALPWSSGCSQVLEEVKRIVHGESSRRPSVPLKQGKTYSKFFLSGKILPCQRSTKGGS